MEGESLKDLICDALETRLASAPVPRTGRAGWRNVFGLAEPKDVANVDQFIGADLERVDPSEWR